jgi:hypothetical protein
MQAVSRTALVAIVAATHNSSPIKEITTMKQLMSVTISLLLVFTLVFAVQVFETQAQMHMDDDYRADYPWDDSHMYDDDQLNDFPCDDDYMADSPWDDDHMADFPWGDDPMNDSPWIDDDHMYGSLPYNMPAAMFWMYFWMWYMMLFMGPGV